MFVEDLSWCAAAHDEPPWVGFDSLLPVHAEIEEWYPGVSETGTVQVPVTTLDALLDGQNVSLLKLDVQGAERAVIEGGHIALSRTAAMMIEMNFVSHYAGDSVFHELHGDLVAQGFHLQGIGEPYRDPSGRALWADAVYVRS